jgi:hypothetical protein
MLLQWVVVVVVAAEAQSVARKAARVDNANAVKTMV